MVEISRTEYLDSLTQLAKKHIENPKEKDLAHFTPHLTPEQREDVFVTTKKDNTVYVAVPPTLVRHAYNVISYRPEPLIVNSGKVYPPGLEFAFSARTPASYSNGIMRGDIFHSMPHQNSAMQFANEYWGSQLRLDDWQDVAIMYVQDPLDLYTKGALFKGSPKTKATIYYALSEKVNNLYNDHSKPQSLLIDDALAVATLNYIEGCEIKGGRGQHINYNCAHCGEGLGLSSCPGCAHQFRDNHFRSGGSHPISTKLVQLLEANDHTFKMNPAIALERERNRWEQVQVRLTQRATQSI